MKSANKLVTLVSAIYYGKEISGTYPLLSVREGSDVRDVKLKIIKDGAIIRVHAYKKDMQIVFGDGEMQPMDAPVVKPPLTEAELSAKIASRFRIMNNMAQGLINADIQALIVSGAPGVGKTFDIEGAMQKALLAGKINKFSHLKGKITQLALFMTLYDHSKKGDVIMFDDIDNIYADEQCMNFLKGALDTGKRNISYNTTSTFLAENGYPTEFEFEGTIVFVTNTDFDQKIAKGGSNAEHYKALISRSNYLDLLVHTNYEILIRVKQIVSSTNIIKQNGLTEEQGEESIQWMSENYVKMREVSIRTILKIANYMKTDYTNWKETAEVMLLLK